MHLEAHAGVGWAIGVLATRGARDPAARRIRSWCLLAAILPDIDAAAYLAGPEAYMNWHHTFGHNVFLGAVAAAAGAWRVAAAGGSAAPAAVLVALAFASHLASDMKLSAYPVCLFWPVSRAEYEFPDNLALVAPINTWLVYASFAWTALLAVALRLTPLDVLSPRLDRVLVRFFEPRALACAACGRACNERCDGCGAATCFRDGRIARGPVRVLCAACALAPAGRSPYPPPS